MGAVKKKDCIMRRKFQRWAKRMGGKTANVAVGHSLLKVAWGVLKTGQPYREPDPGIMHEMERQKLVRHHARRLRALGAEPDAIEAIVDRLLSPGPTAEESQSSVAMEEACQVEEAQVAAPRKHRRACPPKGRGEVCRGKLGFRVRQKRTPVSVINLQPGKRSSTDLSKKTRKRSQRCKGSDAAPA